MGIIDTARALMSLGFLEPVYVSPREEASGRSDGSLVLEQLLMMAFDVNKALSNDLHVQFN